MEPQHTGRNLALGVLIFVLGFGIGAFVSYRYYSSISYQAGFSAAKSLVENSTLGSTLLRTPSDVRTLAGTVTAVNGTSITLHTISNDPFADASLADRTVLVGASTKIIALTQKDPQTLQTEMMAFSKAPKSASMTPPMPFTQTTVDISSIKVGSAITVIASENIASAKQFTADQIQLQLQSQAMTTTPSLPPTP